MIKVFCDWCHAEILAGGGMGGQFGRRVQLENLKVLFTFEFGSTHKPEHLCATCAGNTIREALQVFLADDAKGPGR